MYPTIKGKGCEISVIEASQSEQTATQLITFVAKYWRPIHSEVMTHRVFSRNASSSRAIPTAKLLDQIRTEPAGPIHWGKNQSGMQAHEEHDAVVIHPNTGIRMSREEAWEAMANDAADWAQAWADAGYHKQLVNRIIEPYSYITVVITSTSWDNFYSLRAHADAQPEIQDVAQTMLKIVHNVPMRIIDETDESNHRAWHLPFVSLEERHEHHIALLLAMSAARCARTSYLTHDKKNPSWEQDDSLYRRLVESEPLHASPLEHQAYNFGKHVSIRNFTGGWYQHRDLLEAAMSIEAFRKSLGYLS
jgi:thymidylate synthase ThyX